MPDYIDIPEFLGHLGKRMGKLKKGLNLVNELMYYNTLDLNNVLDSTFIVFCLLFSGGVPDVVAAGKMVLRDWNRYGGNFTSLQKYTV